jgi:5-methylthioribose kinase
MIAGMVSDSGNDQRDASLHVLRCIADNCDELAKRFDCFRQIQDGLQRGDSLRANPLTGGLTNYSYQVYLERSPNVTVFAKICFPYALWNPNSTVPYDVRRTQNEFKMMQLFADVAPGTAPLPYLCAPVDDMMVLLTEWCDDEVQLANQVVDGRMDFRVCRKLARSIAKLHCQSFDPEFNTEIRQTMLSTFQTLQNKLESMFKSTDNSRATQLVQSMDLKVWTTLVQTIQHHYEHSRDCLVHSDLHVKNILVDRMAMAGNGSFHVVDFEMAFAGPIGRDLGTFYPFLLGCALAHALSGNWEGTYNLLEAVDLIWEEYSSGLRKEGKSQEFVDYAFQSVLGWCGRFMFLGFFTAGTHVADFPVDNKADRAILLDAIGVLGLKLMLLGFDKKCDDITSDFHQLFKNTIWTEIESTITLKAHRAATLLVRYWKSQ